MTGRSFLFWVLGVTLGLSLLYVRARFLILEMSYAVNERQAKKSQLVREVRALELELATLKRPNRIESIAKKRLGLTRLADMKNVVVVEGEDG